MRRSGLRAFDFYIKKTYSVDLILVYMDSKRILLADLVGKQEN